MSARPKKQSESREKVGQDVDDFDWKSGLRDMYQKAFLIMDDMSTDELQRRGSFPEVDEFSPLSPRDLAPDSLGSPANFDSDDEQGTFASLLKQNRNYSLGLLAAYEVMHTLGRIIAQLGLRSLSATIPGLAYESACRAMNALISHQYISVAGRGDSWACNLCVVCSAVRADAHFTMASL
jgi:hypothetical protein